MALLKAEVDVYIPEPLPEMAEPETQLSRERKRKGKAPMELSVSTGVPPHEPVPFTIFREEQEPMAQPPAEEEESVLVIQTPCSKRIAAAKRKHGQKLPGQ